MVSETRVWNFNPLPSCLSVHTLVYRWHRLINYRLGENAGEGLDFLCLFVFDEVVEGGEDLDGESATVLSDVFVSGDDAADDVGDTVTPVCGERLVEDEMGFEFSCVLVLEGGYTVAIIGQRD